MDQLDDTPRKNRMPIVEPALRGAILATPMIAALLGIYVAYGSDSRISVAIDKTLTGSITSR